MTEADLTRAKPTTGLKHLAAASRWTEWRLKLDATLRRACLLAVPGLAVAAGFVTWVKVWQPGADDQAPVLYVGLGLLLALLVATFAAWLAPLPKFTGALALDRAHGLKDRITNALAFAGLQPTQRTPLMDAAIDDAVVHARDLRPSQAAPFHFPQELPLVVVLVGGLVLLGHFEIRTQRVLPPPAQLKPMVLSPDDVELLREMRDELAEKASKDQETQAAVQRFNQLVEDVANRRLGREEVFKRLKELETQLKGSVEAEKKALDQALESMARELEKSGLTKPAADAMKQKRLADAEKALRELAERLKKKERPPTKGELEQLRRSLEQASKTNAERSQRLEARRKEVAEEQKRLLKKKADQKGKLDQKDQRKLDQTERQLERLDRQKRQADNTQKKLSKLDEELAKAAEALKKQMGDAAKHLEDAAEDLNRMARKEMTDSQKRDLLKKLRDMQEMLRQQGAGGKKRLERMLEFGKRARGGKQGQQGQEGKEPGKGQGKRGKGQKGGAGMEQGDDVEIPIPGGGKQPGSGQGKEGGKDGDGKGQGEGQGKDGDEKGNHQGGGKGGKDWGNAHDENLRGDKSKLQGKTHDVTAAAQDSGEGKASSKTIMGAAQRGFVGRGYRKVYTDYRTVAEQTIHDERIPPGYRFWVKRYFQLIRPRD